MIRDDVLSEVRDILRDTCRIDPAAVDRDRSWVADLGVDSVTMVDVVVAVEDFFGVVIPDDDWARFHTVGDLLTHLALTGVGE